MAERESSGKPLGVALAFTTLAGFLAGGAYHLTEPIRQPNPADPKLNPPPESIPAYPGDIYPKICEEVTNGIRPGQQINMKHRTAGEAWFRLGQPPAVDFCTSQGECTRINNLTTDNFASHGKLPWTVHQGDCLIPVEPTSQKMQQDLNGTVGNLYHRPSRAIRGNIYSTRPS